MSRHVIRDDQQYECVVGWDPPLRTFFALVYDKRAFRDALIHGEDTDEVIELWAGTRYGEIVNVLELAAVVRPWASVDETTLARLAAEQTNPN